MSKILLVEDNESNRTNRDLLSRRVLRRAYEVLIALDGESDINVADTVAEAEAPDLILINPMDMSLPILDVWEATHRLKASFATQHIPVVAALTAQAMSSDRDKALEAVCDDCDTKPIELPPRLLEKIEALLTAAAKGGCGETA